MTYYTTFESFIGPLLLSSDGKILTGLGLPRHRDAEIVREGWIHDDAAAPFREVRRQLQAYFDGKLTEFDLPLLAKGTAFQQKVWRELREIPYGRTISYIQLAQRVGNAKASRAVGLANGRNPIPIIIPCHRVIGSNGKLVGYGGGLGAKQALLDFEATAVQGRTLLEFANMSVA